jgi:hypothetical protein
MALRGTLQDFGLADIFQLIGIQRKTGVLSLKTDRETVTVAFMDGQVVGADSSARRLEDRLGSVLAKSGRISEAQLQEALRLQKSTLKRLGNILVESHFIDAKTLSEALQVQISQMVYRLFRWTSGEYNFSQEERVDFDKDLVVPMSAESILMEGARILDEWPMVEKGIRSFNAVYRRAEVEIARKASAPAAREEAAGAVTLSDMEQHVYSHVDGRRSVQEIVERSMLSEFDTCRTLYELINRQILEEVRGPAVRGAEPVARPRTSSPVLASIVALFLVLLVGGAVAFRALPWMVALRGGGVVATWINPLLTAPGAAKIGRSIERNRIQHLDFAVQVYFLLNRGYPVELRNLVTEGLIKPADTLVPSGGAILYERTGAGYRIGASE